MTSIPSSTRRLAALLFFCSGACSLVYEVVWTRLMTQVFGTTALAVGTVLAAYMTGLAIGSVALGRAADRTGHPLRWYAKLEIGVALAAALAHVLLTRITPAYLAVYAICGHSAALVTVVRFVIAFALIAAPTALMGATLPALSRFVVGAVDEVGESLSTLYSLNTAGAMAGAFVSGFFLIGALGLHGAVAAAVVLNTLVGAAAWHVAGRVPWPLAAPEPAATPMRRPSAEVPPGVRRVVLFALALSGLASFAYEVLWARCLHFLTGNSTYAVTLTLVAFLAGTALGGWAVRWLLRATRDAVLAFGVIQVAIAVTAALAMPLLFSGFGPERVRGVTWGAGAFWSLAVMRFVVSFLVMLLPASLIGATFPLAGRIGVTSMASAGSGIGRVYAFNTAGNVLGALLPGVVLIHALGIERGLLLMATLNLAIGAAVVFTRSRALPVLAWAVPAGAAILAAVAWVHPPPVDLPLAEGGRWYRVLFRRDGPSATTAVLLHPDTGERTMTVDGVPIGGTGVTDYKQQLLAHLPLLFGDAVTHQLSVGLGSGVLARASAGHAEVASVACVEIEPTVVEGAAAAFPPPRLDPRTDARLRVVVDDVANFLRATPERFDVVTADEKTAEEYASNGFSYSLDYYTLLRRRLRPGGIAVQWVPTALPHRQYRMVLRTFASAFPHVGVWHFGPALLSGTSNTILVGSNEPITPDPGRARARMAAEPGTYDGLARYGIDAPEIAFAQFFTDRAALDSALAGEPVNTLAHPRYEFYAPGDYALPALKRLRANLDFLLALRDATPPNRRVAAGDSTLAPLRAAEDAYLSGCRALLHGEAPEQTIAHFDRALSLAPGNAHLRQRVFAQYWQLGGIFLSMGNPEATAELEDMGLRAWDRSGMGFVEHAETLERLGDLAGAIGSARRGLALEPGRIAGHRVLARLLARAGEPAAARRELAAILAIDPTDVAARDALSGP